MQEGRLHRARDAQASIALAEAQFRDGRYLDAKWTLRDATRRNARFASSDPKPVAALYEAYATVSWQEGDQDVFKRATADRVRTLRDHLPPDDINVRAAALALGDMWIRLKKTASSRPAGIAIADGLRLGLASVAAKRGSP